MANLLEYCVPLPLETVRDRVRTVLVRRGYAVQLDSRGHGRAERGASWRETLLGSVAKHVRFVIRFSASSDTTVLQLERETSGWVGGLLGSARNGREIDSVRDALADALQAPCLV